MATLSVYLSSHLHAAFVVLYDFVATIQDACKMLDTLESLTDWLINIP